MALSFSCTVLSKERTKDPYEDERVGQVYTKPINSLILLERIFEAVLKLETGRKVNTFCYYSLQLWPEETSERVSCCCLERRFLQRKRKKILAYKVQINSLSEIEQFIRPRVQDKQDIKAIFIFCHDVEDT